MIIKLWGGSFCFYYENDSIYTFYYAGLRNYNKKIFPTHIAIMGVIKFAIKNNLKFVDFMGAGTPGVDYGVREFKSKFGGDLKEYGRFIRINKPKLYNIGKLGLRVSAKDKMNILIDIGHPAHIHYYRNLAKVLEKSGHKITWTIKNIEILKRLLDIYGFSYYTLPGKVDNLLGKIMRQVQFDIKLLNICRREKIDVAIGTSVSVAHVSRILKVKSIIFDDDDDEVQPMGTKYVNPFADTLLSPDSLKGKENEKSTIYYAGFHELAYLHPNRFHPDESVLSKVGLKKGETFFIMRFNVFKAHHDVGIKGLTLKQKIALIDILKPYGRIFITTERKIEPELKEYQLPISPENIHSFMAHATIFLGDDQTMTSEAAMLGVPSLRCNSFVGKISYLEEEEGISMI